MMTTQIEPAPTDEEAAAIAAALMAIGAVHNEQVQVGPAHDDVTRWRFGSRDW